MESNPESPPDSLVPFASTLRAVFLLFWGVVMPVGYVAFVAITIHAGFFRASNFAGRDYAVVHQSNWILAIYAMLCASVAPIARAAWQADKIAVGPGAAMLLVSGVVNWTVLTWMWVAAHWGRDDAWIIVVLIPVVGLLGSLPWLAAARLVIGHAPWEAALHGPVLLASMLLSPFYVVIALFFAPPLALASYVWVCWELLRDRSSRRLSISLKAILALFALASVHLAVWRMVLEPLFGQQGNG